MQTDSIWTCIIWTVCSEMWLYFCILLFQLIGFFLCVYLVQYLQALRYVSTDMPICTLKELVAAVIVPCVHTGGKDIEKKWYRAGVHGVTCVGVCVFARKRVCRLNYCVNSLSLSFIGDIKTVKRSIKTLIQLTFCPSERYFRGTAVWRMLNTQVSMLDVQYVCWTGLIFINTFL